MLSKAYCVCSNLLTNTTRLLLCLPLGMALIYAALQLDSVQFVTPLLYLAFLSIGCTLVREYASKLSLFIALHTAMAIISVLISLLSPILFVRYVAFFFIVLEIGLSLRQQLRPARLLNNTPLLYLAPFFAGVLFARKTDAFDLLFVILFSVCILMYLLNTYILNFIKYTHIDNERYPSLFLSIAKTYHILLFIFALAVLGVVFISHLIPLGEILSAVGSGLLWGIRWIVQITKKEPSASAPSQDDLSPEQSDISSLLPSDVEVSPFWAFLNKAIHVIVPVFLVVLGVVVIGYIVYQIYKRFYSKSIKTAVAEEITQTIETAEKLERPTLRMPTVLKNLFSRDPSTRIRRYFIKLVTAQHKNINLAKTASELVCKPNAQNADEMAWIYAKARYGNNCCEKTDADRFKFLYKKHK